MTESHVAWLIADVVAFAALNWLVFRTARQRGIAVACIVGGYALGYGGARTSDSAEAERWMPAPILVAATSIRAGELITEEAVLQRFMRAGEITASMILPDQRSHLVGQVARVDLQEGDPFYSQHVGPPLSDEQCSTQCAKLAPLTPVDGGSEVHP